jgi:hypothetical protein
VTALPPGITQQQHRSRIFSSPNKSRSVAVARKKKKKRHGILSWRAGTCLPLLTPSLVSVHIMGTKLPRNCVKYIKRTNLIIQSRGVRLDSNRRAWTAMTVGTQWWGRGDDDGRIVCDVLMCCGRYLHMLSLGAGCAKFCLAARQKIAPAQPLEGKKPRATWPLDPYHGLFALFTLQRDVDGEAGTQLPRRVKRYGRLEGGPNGIAIWAICCTEVKGEEGP